MKSKIEKLLLWLKKFLFKDYKLLDMVFYSVLEYCVVISAILGLFVWMVLSLFNYITRADSTSLFEVIYFMSCMNIPAVLICFSFFLFWFVRFLFRLVSSCIIRKLEYDDSCLYIKGKRVLFQDITQIEFGEEWVVIFFNGTHETIYISSKDKRYKFLIQLANELNV